MSPSNFSLARFDVQDLMVGAVLLFPPVALGRVSKGIVMEAIGERFSGVQFLPDTIQLQNPFTRLTCLVLPIRLDLKKEDPNGLQDRQIDADATIPKLTDLFGIKQVSALGLNFKSTFKVPDIPNSGRTIIERYTKLGEAEERLNLKFNGVGLRITTNQEPYHYDFKFEPWFQDQSKFYAEINAQRNAPDQAALRNIDRAIQEQYDVFESLMNAVLNIGGAK